MMQFISKINEADWKKVLIVAVLVMVIFSFINQLVLGHFFKSTFIQFNEELTNHRNNLISEHKKAALLGKELSNDMDRIHKNVEDTINKAHDRMQKKVDQFIK